MNDYDTHEKAGVIPLKNSDLEDYGYLKTFCIDRKAKRKVLVTGANSYIGESFAFYAKEHFPNLNISTLDMTSSLWKEYDFTPYDAVFHVAGIAHADVGNVSDERKKQYYNINTDLAVETAKKCKKSGVRQFVFMSSMIIYGDSAPYGKQKIIDENTVPNPGNFYGDSKWQADKRVRELSDNGFHVAVLRCPMIYGNGSKGNYQILNKIAKTIPIFPDVRNSRSMLYIDNLCEFLCLLILSGEGGIYFPQNESYTNTSFMVKQIAKANGMNIRILKLLNILVKIGCHVPGKIGNIVNKAFGNYVYSQKLSKYKGLEYRIVDLQDSIIRMKKECVYDSTKQSQARINRQEIIDNRASNIPHILIVSQYFYPETFRINDMAMEWIKRGYKVTVVTGIPNYPMGKFFEGYGYRKRRHEYWNGIEIIRIPLIPRGSGNMGMIANYFSFVVSGFLWKLKNDIRVDLVFTFEVSPMTQALIGVWCSKKFHIPHFLYVQDLWPENVETITGIHSSVIIKPIHFMVDYIYRNADEIFTTSPAFAESIANRMVKVPRGKVHYWPQYAEEFYRKLDRTKVREKAEMGSPVELIPDDDSFKVVFTGNIGKAQGLDILPKTAELLQDIHVRFVIVGDGRYQEQLEEEIRNRNVGEKFIMIPRQKAEAIPDILAVCDAAFLSFMDTELFEKTIPAKLQSYMACGMPVVAAVKGEAERVIKEAGCGVCVGIGDSTALADAIKGLIGKKTELERMGENARDSCTNWFNKTKLMDEMDDYIRQALKSSASIEASGGLMDIER